MQVFCNIKYRKFYDVLCTETDRLRPSSLSEHKTNLYFQEVIIVNKEVCSLLIELIATTWTLKFYN